MPVGSSLWPFSVHHLHFYFGCWCVCVIVCLGICGLSKAILHPTEFTAMNCLRRQDDKLAPTLHSACHSTLILAHACPPHCTFPFRPFFLLFCCLLLISSLCVFLFSVIRCFGKPHASMKMTYVCCKFLCILTSHFLAFIISDDLNYPTAAAADNNDDSDRC